RPHAVLLSRQGPEATFGSVLGMTMYTARPPASVRYSSVSEPTVEQFAARYPFPLDRFQRQAIAELAGGGSVMVAAPTGSGKTIVAEFGVFRARARGRR